MAEWRSVLRHDLRPPSFAVVRPSQSERLVYLENGLTVNHQITKFYTDLLYGHTG